MYLEVGKRFRRQGTHVTKCSVCGIPVTHTWVFCAHTLCQWPSKVTLRIATSLSGFMLAPSSKSVGDLN